MNCYVLVGGLSRRMGQSKAALPFAGSTFLDRVVGAAGSAFDEIVIVGRTKSAAEVPSTALGAGSGATLRTLVEPPHEESAPVFGVMRALSDADGKCFAMAVDYPLMTTDVLLFLRDVFEKSAAKMLVPVWRDKPQMLCAGYSSSLLPLLERRLATRRLDLRGLLEEAGAEMIPELDLRKRFSGEPLMNVNTPAELEEARDLYGQ